MEPDAQQIIPPASQGLDWAHPLVREWFLSRFGTPTEPQEQGWPHILAGRDHADLRAHRLRQNAGGISGLHRPSGAQGACRRTAGPHRSPLRLAAEGAGQRHSEESGSAAGRNSAAGRPARAADARRFAPPCAPATRWRTSGAPCSRARRTSWSPRRNRSTSC